MKLKSMLNVDFIPMIKQPIFWISPETLKQGSIIEVPGQIGHQLLAQFPASFQVISYEEPAAEQPSTKRRNKQVVQADIQTGPSETFAVGVE